MLEGSDFDNYEEPAEQTNEEAMNDINDESNELKDKSGEEREKSMRLGKDREGKDGK